MINPDPREGERTHDLDATVVRVAAVDIPGYHAHGPLASTPVHLLRLGMCNLACDWCEAPETVAAFGSVLDTTAPYVTVEDLAHFLTPLLDADPQVPLLITGGEPLLQDHAILDLTQRLDASGFTVQVWVETNGTIAPPDWWTDWITGTIVSPKLGTHDPAHRRLVETALRGWADLAHAGVAIFDFTAATRSDILLAVQCCSWLGLSPLHATVTPRGTGHDQQAESLAAIHDTALTHGFRLTPRPLTLETPNP